MFGLLVPNRQGTKHLGPCPHFSGAGLCTTAQAAHRGWASGQDEAAAVVLEHAVAARLSDRCHFRSAAALPRMGTGEYCRVPACPPPATPHTSGPMGQLSPTQMCFNLNSNSFIYSYLVSVLSALWRSVTHTSAEPGASLVQSATKAFGSERQN